MVFERDGVRVDSKVFSSAIDAELVTFGRWACRKAIAVMAIERMSVQALS